MPRVGVVGNFVVDIIGKPIDRLPERGQLSLLDTLETHVGGNAPNTAAALARLGTNAAVFGRVGEDLYGRFLLEQLDRWGVDTGGVVRDRESTTGVTLVAVDSTGERSFLHHLGANARFTSADVAPNDLESLGHLHLTSLFVLPGIDGAPAVELLASARRRGLTTSADVCWDREGRWLALLAPLLPHVDYFMPSEEEARRMTDEKEPAAMARALLDRGCRAVVLKLGAQGCYYLDAEQALPVTAFDVPMRESTGAGDCFIAGFLHARLRGWPLERALTFANACGARAVTAVGAVTAMRPADEIETWARAQRLRERT